MTGKVLTVTATGAGSVEREINDLLIDVDHSSTSTSKYNPLSIRLAEITGLARSSVYAVYLSKPGNVTVRMEQSKRAMNARLRVGLVAESGHLDFVKAAVRSLAERSGHDAAYLLLLRTEDGTWRIVWGLSPESGNLLEALRAVVVPFPVDTYRSRSTPSSDFGQRNPSVVASVPVGVPLILEPRIVRMFRNAVASQNAIMLIGPPGTGKSTLVRQMAQELLDNPSSYGMTRPHELMTITADESWTTRELVGGETVDDQARIRFAPGYVLQAIQRDKWLLLDEANRADLDRIFGGLLTWLSGQEVTVGRFSPATPAEIVLGWSDEPDSSAPEGLQNEDVDPDERLVFRAGSEWRLIGTYNSVDAHRVFRMGLALGRRFAQVPIAPPSVEQFSQVVEQHLADGWSAELADRAGATVKEIYAIHSDIGANSLGPAPFLSMLPYLEAADEDEMIDFRELAAEAYLAAFGTWLARQEESVVELFGSRLSRPGVLGDQWGWILPLLGNLA